MTDKFNGFNSEENCGYRLCKLFHPKQIKLLCPFVRDGLVCLNHEVIGRVKKLKLGEKDDR